MYIHYPSKQVMLHKLSLLGHRACLESLVNATSIEGGPRKRLRAAAYDFTFWHAKHHVTARTIHYALHHLDEEHHAEVAQVRRAIHGVVEGVIREGVAAGDFAVADASTATLAILSMAIDSSRWFPSRSMSDPAELAAHYAALVDRMVAAT